MNDFGDVEAPHLEQGLLTNNVVKQEFIDNYLGAVKAYKKDFNKAQVRDAIQHGFETPSVIGKTGVYSGD